MGRNPKYVYYYDNYHHVVRKIMNEETTMYMTVDSAKRFISYVPFIGFLKYIKKEKLILPRCKLVDVLSKVS